MATDAEMLARLHLMTLGAAVGSEVMPDDQAAILWALATMERYKGTLSNLVTRLDQVHADPDYHGVWAIAQMHRGPYTGLTYTVELDAARATLAPPPPAPAETEAKS